MWEAVESYSWLVVIASAAVVGLLAMWVTFSEPKTKKAQYVWMCIFALFSGVGIAAAVIDHHAGEREQATRFTTLNSKIEQSTELREGFLSQDNVIIRQQTSFLEVGHEFGGNFVATNKGTARIFNATGLTAAYVVDVDENTEKMVRQAFSSTMQPIQADFSAGKITGRSELAPGESIFGTSVTRPLTKHDVQGLKIDKVRIYFLSWGAWRDSRGKQGSSYDCRYLQSWTLSAPYHAKDIVWHYCGQ